MKLEAFFHTHPVFRFEEFRQWRMQFGSDNLKAAHKVLFYHTKLGRLLNIRRGIYAVVPLDEIPEQLAIDSYIFTSKVANDSVLAYHTALELHGVAYSAFQQFYFLTSQKIKSFEFRGQRFQPVAFPLSLIKNKNSNYGIEKINRQGLVLQITNLSRTFVDVLDRVELCGGWEEVVRSISNMAVLDINSVIHYCLLLNSHILAAKVGYFLEQRQGAFAVSEKILQPLLKKKPATPQSLVSHDRQGGQLVKKWNIILPLRVIKNSWEEPNYDV